MGIKNLVLSAEKQNGRKLTMIPTQLLIAPARGSIETKKNDIKLTAKVFRFSNCELKGEIIKWSVAPEDDSLVELKVSEDGTTCQVIPKNTNDETSRLLSMPPLLPVCRPQVY